MQDSFRLLPSLEGYLSFQELLGSVSPLTEAPAPCSESADWIKRWCSLEDGVLKVYNDRTSAEARPEHTLRTIYLTRYQHLKSSVDYDANGSGRCELTLVDEMLGSPALPLLPPPKSRAIPRSSTSASLSMAFERSASASQASVFKRPIPNLRSRQWSESTDSINERSQNASTWSNKFASKSKKFYQLMASNISSQSLSEQGDKQHTSEGSDGSNSTFPSMESSATLMGMSSSVSTVNMNNFAALRQQQGEQTKSRYQQQQTSSTLTLRPQDARSMMEWAQAISRCLGASARVLRSPASLSSLPSHARPRRPRLASQQDEEEGSPLYPPPGSTSSLVSAAMASRRKREDSAAKIVALKKDLQARSKQASPALRAPIQAAEPTIEQSKSLFAAIKAKRRASLEVFASALSARKSSSDFENRTTTNSTGNSTRSSICCAGEAARMSWERSNRSNNSPSMAGSPPPTSLTFFSSPFSINRTVFTSARRSISIKSTHSSVQQHNGNIAPVAPSAAVAASMTNSASFLDMNTSSSSAEDFDASQQSAESSNLPSPLSVDLLTPLMGEVGGEMTTNKEMKSNDSQTGWPKNSSSMLGLNLYYDNFKDNKVGHEMVVPSLPYRAFEAQSVIVESPTREDLATLFGNNQEITEVQEDKLSAVKVAPTFRRSSHKLATSPSMPMLHRDFTSSKAAGTDEEAAEVNNNTSLLTQLQASSMKFATFGKSAGRRPMFQHAPKAVVAKGGVTASSSTRSNLMNKISTPTRVTSPLLQRPSTSTGFRDHSDYFVSEEQAARNTNAVSATANPKPIVERILPPEEMIATFDRLRSQSSTYNLYQPSKIRPSISRPVLMDSYSIQQQQNRARSPSNTSTVRPRTSAMTAF